MFGMLEAFFVAQTLAMAGVLVWMSRRAGFAVGRFAAMVAGWLALTYGVAWAGWLQFGAVPPPVFAVVTVAMYLTVRVAHAPGMTNAGIGVLIGYQVFRVFVEIFLHQGYRAGFVPVQMTWDGRNWDVLTGVSAPVVAWLAARGRISRTGILVWNLAGLALLVNIVAVAILSMPTPFRQFMNEPANRFVATAPYVWLPGFLVPCALLGHLLVFRWLRLR